MVHAVEKLYLIFEVAGRPTICRHCWAKGTGYQAMPVGDIAFVLEQAHRFCEEHGLGFGAYPMHEVAAHPQATVVLRLFTDHVGASEFQPLTTTGVPLATCQDWAELLTTAAQLGTTTVWVAFHGVGAVHDRQVNRPGGYAETCLTVQRVHDVGLRAGCNIFLTKPSAAQAGQLIDDLQQLRIDCTSWEVAAYYPSPRQRRGEPPAPRGSGPASATSGALTAGPTWLSPPGAPSGTTGPAGRNCCSTPTGSSRTQSARATTGCSGNSASGQPPAARTTATAETSPEWRAPRAAEREMMPAWRRKSSRSCT